MQSKSKDDTMMTPRGIYQWKDYRIIYLDPLKYLRIWDMTPKNRYLYPIRIIWTHKIWYKRKDTHVTTKHCFYIHTATLLLPKQAISADIPFLHGVIGRIPVGFPRGDVPPPPPSSTSGGPAACEA